jgi:hypothetical protein
MRRIFAALLLLLGSVGPTHAGPLTLTAAGIADGFTLSTYATGVGGANYSFIAAAPLSDGNLAVIDYSHGLLRKYADVDGQTYGSALSSVPYGNAVNVVRAGGNTYASQLGGGISQVSSSLVLTPVTVTGFFTSYYGMAANPVTGHIYANGNGSAGFGLYDINPVSLTSSLIVNEGAPDGVSVSPDGKTVYVENNGNSIQGYNTTTYAQVFNHGFGGNPDGTGVISGGLFDGYIVANNNDGTVGLIDPLGNETIIASGGNRGDFTSPDTNNGTLLMSEYDFSYRLTAPGGTFGGGTAPEPATLTMLGIGIVSMAGYGWRRRKPAAV